MEHLNDFCFQSNLNGQPGSCFKREWPNSICMLGWWHLLLWGKQSGGSSVVWARKDHGSAWAGNSRVGEVWGSAISHTVVGLINKTTSGLRCLTVGDENDEGICIIYNKLWGYLTHTQCLRGLIRMEQTRLNLIANGFLKRTESRSLGSPQA